MKDCNLVEASVKRKVLKSDINWFPMGRSISMGIYIIFIIFNF